MGNFKTDKKKLLANFFSLSAVEVANYIFPLITLPYLVRVLGPDKFGLIAFVQAVVQYFLMLTDYGFNLSATRNIAVQHGNRKEISRIFSSVIFIKFVFMFISFFLLMGIVLSIPKFRGDLLLYLYAFGSVLGNVLFPVWLFQGLEKMKFIAVLNLIAKTVFVASVFVFIRNTNDYVYVPLINSLGFMVSGVISLYVAIARFKITFQIPTLTQIKEQLKDGWHVFISTAAISLYTTSNTFILGLLCSNTVVGYYSAAEKVIRSGQRLLGPISQTIYPHINKLVVDSKVRAIHFIKKALFYIGGGSFLVSVIVFIFSDLIVKTLFGAQYQESIYVLKILAFLPFLIALSNILGIQTMLTLNMQKAFSKILVYAGFINIPLALILVPLYNHIGMAVSVLATELFVTLTMFCYLQRKGLFSTQGNHEKI